MFVVGWMLFVTMAGFGNGKGKLMGGRFMAKNCSMRCRWSAVAAAKAEGGIGPRNGNPLGRIIEFGGGLCAFSGGQTILLKLELMNPQFESVARLISLGYLNFGV